MPDHPALYGLMSSLPALSLSEPVAVSLPVWQWAANGLQPNENAVIAALYAPQQWSAFLGRSADPTALPAPTHWRVYAHETAETEWPFRQRLRLERAQWSQWLMAQPYPMLHQWLALHQELENTRLAQWSAKQPWIASLSGHAEVTEKTEVEWPAADGSLWQHATELYEQEYRTDQLLWHWLSEQVFYRPFTFDALLSYTLRQQMQHRWWVLAQAETTSLLENIIHESLA